MAVALADEQFLTEPQLAERWNYARKTLRNHRSLRRGCPFVRLGRAVRYRLSDVLAFERAGDGRP